MRHLGTCEDCGKQTSYKKITHCPSCARKGARAYQWGKGEATTPNGGRAMARRHFDLGPCKKCGAPGTDRHHHDGNPLNNAEGNVYPLCRRCHMALDGRLAAMVGRNKQGRTVPPKPCAQCARLMKPLRLGLCGRCYDAKYRPRRKHNKRT